MQAHTYTGISIPKYKKPKRSYDRVPFKGSKKGVRRKMRVEKIPFVSVFKYKFES